MIDLIEILSQKINTKEGNDCSIHEATIILKWNNKYIVLNLAKFDGNWVDNEIHLQDFSQFETVEDAKKEMERITNYE